MELLNISPETIASRGQAGIELLKAHGVKIFVAIAVFRTGMKVIKRVDEGIDTLLRKAKVDPSLRKFLESLFSAILKIILVVIALGVAGVDTGSFLAIFGAAGLAVGLALQGSLANFASGIMLLLFKPYKIGDFVTVNGETGTVQAIAVFNTTILTPDNKTITIPNSLITSGNITNVTNHGNLRVDVNVGVSYDADLAKTKEVLNKIITDHDNVLDHDGNGVYVSELGDSSVNLIVRGYAKPEHYRKVFFDLTEQSKIALDNNKIDIPYPHQVVHRHDMSKKG